MGSRKSKRTIFFQQAAHELGLSFTLLDWEDLAGFCPGDEAEYFIKIDPPVWDSCSLLKLNALSGQYIRQLHALQRLPSAVFLNHPSAILDLLDKRGCKQTLSQAGIPVTKTLKAPVKNGEQLIEAMKQERMLKVFLKPVYGSGAAGVAAFGLQPHTGRMVIYTCALIEPGGTKLLNTKQLRCFTKPKEILVLLDSLLSLDCIVERWYPKAKHQGLSYDLRAVYQDNRLDYLLARLSEGPITNLHLNNHPLAASELKLSDRVLSDIRDLCKKACSCYPGLKSAGIDILLERSGLKPRIVEMNGQGDLIYQDMYQDNRIYLHQADMMKRWLKGGQ